jgi:hypothetical protein
MVDLRRRPGELENVLCELRKPLAVLVQYADCADYYLAYFHGLCAF